MEKRKKKRKANPEKHLDPHFWERHERVQRRLIDAISDPALKAEMERLSPPPRS